MPLLGQQLGAVAGVVGFHQLPVRVAVQKVAALAQGHGVRVHGLHLGQRGAGQRQQVLVNGQVHLARYAHGVALQQQVVGQNAAGQRVFHGHQAGTGGALHHVRYHRAEGGAGQQRRLRAEVPAGGYFVETSLETLNGNVLGHDVTCWLVVASSVVQLPVVEFLTTATATKIGQ